MAYQVLKAACPCSDDDVSMILEIVPACIRRFDDIQRIDGALGVHPLFRRSLGPDAQCQSGNTRANTAKLPEPAHDLYRDDGMFKRDSRERWLLCFALRWPAQTCSRHIDVRWPSVCRGRLGTSEQMTTHYPCNELNLNGPRFWRRAL
jgi:hypothetical protein